MKKPFCLFLFCVLILVCCFATEFDNGIVRFSVPSQLEIQNETMSSLQRLMISDNQPSNPGSEQIILQQKGLNSIDKDSYQHYCRVIITIVADDESSPITNSEFEEYFLSLSDVEKNYTYDDLEDTFGEGTKIISSGKRETTFIDGKFAIHVGYLRKSVNEWSPDVHVDGYLVFLKGYLLFITCSYRVTEADLFKPAINEFMDSFAILVEEKQQQNETEKNVELYEHILPWCNDSFLWPERSIKWDSESVTWGSESDYISQYKNATYTDSDGFSSISLEVMSIPFSSYTLSKSYMVETLDQLFSSLKESLYPFPVSVVDQTCSEKKAEIVFSSSLFGSELHGNILYKSISPKIYLILICIYDDDSAEAFNRILGSF